MARTRKSASPPGCETLPVLHPEIGSLPLWCTMLFSLLLAALMEIFLLRAECARAKARLTTFEGLLKKSADFLRTTSENSSWPSSVMSSPVMMRGRRLLESINSALDPARGGEKPRPDRKKAEKDVGGTSGREKAGGSAPPRKARHPGASQKSCKPDEIRDIYLRECPRCHCREFVRTRKYSLFQVLELALRKIVTHCRVWECTCQRLRHARPGRGSSGSLPGLRPRVRRRDGRPHGHRTAQTEGSGILQHGRPDRHFAGGIQKCLDRA